MYISSRNSIEDIMLVLLSTEKILTPIINETKNTPHKIHNKSTPVNLNLSHKNGVKKSTGEFEAGKAIGRWKFFDTDGELSREMDMEKVRVDMYPFLIGEQVVRNEMAFGNFFDSFEDSGFSFSFMVSSN